jgi:hypothetical protein
LRNRANAPVRAFIEGNEYLIGANKSISVKLDKKLVFVSILTNESVWMCHVYVQRGTLNTINQERVDLAHRVGGVGPLNAVMMSPNKPPLLE